MQNYGYIWRLYGYICIIVYKVYKVLVLAVKGQTLI